MSLFATLPFADLIRNGTGNLYGTTLSGGNTSSSCPSGSLGCGLVFKLDRSGKETVLYTFTGGTDGASPAFGVIRDRVGNLYGTTYNGGNTSSSCPFGSLGCGVVFKLDSSAKESVLYTFTGGTDGDLPPGGLVRDPAGDLYGTAALGGGFGDGVVFRLGRSGKYTVLHSFSGTDGASPNFGSLLPYKDSLYGTAGGGGAYGSGVVFKLQ